MQEKATSSRRSVRARNPSEHETSRELPKRHVSASRVRAGCGTLALASAIVLPDCNWVLRDSFDVALASGGGTTMNAREGGAGETSISPDGGLRSETGDQGGPEASAIGSGGSAGSSTGSSGAGGFTPNSGASGGAYGLGGSVAQPGGSGGASGAGGFGAGSGGMGGKSDADASHLGSGGLRGNGGSGSTGTGGNAADAAVGTGGHGGAGHADGGAGHADGGAGHADGGTGCIAVRGGSLWAEWPMPNPPSTGLPNPQSYAWAGAESIRDQVTCLQWQRAAAPGRYSWEGAKNYCDELELDGFADWRLPTRIELVTLVDFTQPGPAIDQSAFPNTPVDSFWTSSPMKRIAASAWRVDFHEGVTNYEQDESVPYSVRCVRAVGASPLLKHFVVGTGAAAGTVYETATGLTWEQAHVTPNLDWSSAVAYCATLDLNGGGWRLPSLVELQTLVDEMRFFPAIDADVFPDTPGSPSWTSSGWNGAPDVYPWYVDFYDGMAWAGYGRETPMSYRCVR